jgi:glycosyltransferase involved in cell wall biosynthesis
VDGVTDAIIQHERNGLLVPPGDLAALQAALRWSLEHRDRAEALGAAARRTIKARFDLGVAADAYFNAYSELLPALANQLRPDGSRSASR